MNAIPQPTPEHGQQPRPAGMSAVAIGTAIVGGLALVSVGVGAAFATTGSILQQVDAPSGDAVQVADTAGITALSVDANAAEFQLRFADVKEAELEVTGSNRQDWRLQRSNDELVVSSGGSWFGGGFCLFGCNFGDDMVVLTLPRSLEGVIDADLSLGAGSLTAEGDFRDLDIEVSAGKALATGSARSLSAELGAGRADFRLDGVQEASFDVSAGKVVAELTGAAPREVELDVSAGSLELTVADVPYAVESRVEAGQLDNKLQTRPNSPNVIEASVSAGSVTLLPSRR